MVPAGRVHRPGLPAGRAGRRGHPHRHEGAGGRALQRGALSWQGRVSRGYAERAARVHPRAGDRRPDDADGAHDGPVRRPGRQDQAHDPPDPRHRRGLRGDGEDGHEAGDRGEPRQARRRAVRAEHRPRGHCLRPDAHAHPCLQRAARARLEGLHRSEGHREVDVREGLGVAVRGDGCPSGRRLSRRHAPGRSQPRGLFLRGCLPRSRSARAHRPGDR